MSPLTAITLLLLCASLLCRDARGRACTLAPWLALAALLPPVIALTGYLFLEQRLYTAPGGVGMALPTALGLLLLAVGGLALHPERGPMGVLTSPAAGGVMTRRMLPALLLPLVVGAATVQGIRSGLFDVGLARPLFLVSMMVALAAILWRNALTLNRLHAEQLQAEQQARAEAERQRALAAENERLYQAAQRAATERQEVLAIVSHDLKNPLSAIRLSTAILSARLDCDPEAKDLCRQVRTIDRSVNNMLTLIHQLLDAARLDSGQALAIERHPEPVDRLVGEALALTELQAAQKALRLEPRLGSGLVVPCDRARILQVLANLLGNAVKFTPEGGTLTVETRPGEGEALVSVRDSGPGIPPAVQPRLFERHWQAEGTAHQGSGLGLYIARGIIEAHGGRIWVDSTPGAGSTFTFSLPLQPQEGEQARLESPGSGV